jgi:hypothetical protein
MQSMVEGARTVRKVLEHQDKRLCKRPAHRTSCGPPSPLSRGGMRREAMTPNPYRVAAAQRAAG